ncbi:MAG: selenocysteine-specific translation elongation factor [Nocardioidaceae bacterium]|nr:selenocysteine-specific translation elongation factor [Nocardioidaceae bacterium]
MHVIATAGHVDHGKSTLVRALTGTDPDRLEEEHRRGLSIQLGYCWTTLEPVGEVAFVDVPGHERFLSTMLSGIGPVPAVMFVVAADDPWMPQAAEHLAALNALGVSRGVVAVTRSDLVDPGPARDRAAAELSLTSLRESPLVTVSGRTGQGLDELRTQLTCMVESLPAAPPAADVRLWVDRRFSIKGAGTVVTGTLSAGRICVGDTLAFDSQHVRIRGVQSLEKPVECASGVARVALNVTGDDLTALDRGSVLVTPSAWHFTDVLDVRVQVDVRSDDSRSSTLPEGPLLHIGATSVATHCRPLADDLVRLRLERQLPLRVGDRALLRDPGSRTLWGVTVLDPAPPPLRRRGAAAERAKALDSLHGGPDLHSEVERRGLVHTSLLERIGLLVAGGERLGAESGGWLLSESRAYQAGREIERIVDEHARQSPLDPGVPLVVLTERLGLPSPELTRAVVPAPLQVAEGRVMAERAAGLPDRLEGAVAAIHEELADDPFIAPTADRLRELGLDHRAVAAAAKAGRLLRLADGIVLLPGADVLASQWLQELPQPFTTSEARIRLGTSRRVVIPLLAHLDKLGSTRRLSDDRRVVVR